VSLKGKQHQLTSENGTHSPTVQKDGSYFIDSYSSIDVPSKTELRSTAGKVLRELASANDPFEGTNIRKPSLSSITGPDGSTLYTRTYLPFDFDPTKKYPVLVYVYGGPHAQMVTNRWNGGGPVLDERIC